MEPGRPGGSTDEKTGSRENGSPDRRRQGQAYQGAFEAVFAILIAVGLGYLADAQFGTSPIGLLVGVGIGFGAFVLRLVRLGRALQMTGDDPGAP